MTRKRAMTWSVFERKYGPVIAAPDGGDVFQTYERNLLTPYATNQVWSLVDAEGSDYVIPGWHVVNMQGYVVTTKPWTPQDDAENLYIKW